jgi:hypothetical protein
MPARRGAKRPDDTSSGWAGIRRTPLLRDLALVVALAALLGALVDYVLKAEAVAYFGKGEHLVRFFGLFYAGTGVAAFLLQATLGATVLRRLGLGGSVASHPVVVGAAGLISFVAPAPWRGILPRGLDVGVRNSIFRAGYELLYTPLPEATKRSAKSIIDVAWDCLGKSAGALVILLLTRFAPVFSLVAVNVASILAAAAEFVVARRLKTGYVRALEGGLRSQSTLEAAQYSLADFTMAESLSGLSRTALLQALGEPGGPKPTPAPSDDPVLAAIADLRSGDLGRIRAALAQPMSDPLMIGALIPLLARREVLRPVGTAIAAFGARAAGQLVDALLDPATPDVVRRRLPLALKSCPSVIALEGLVQALSAPSFELRLRCGRALLALTDEHPELSVHLHPETALAAVERELAADSDPLLALEHVFNLLALALEREPARIAARAFESDDSYVRGTALEYLETVLTPALFKALQPRLAVPVGPAPRRRTTAEVREDLLRAGATMTKVSLEDVRRELAGTDSDDEG